MPARRNPEEPFASKKNGSHRLPSSLWQTIVIQWFGLPRRREPASKWMGEKFLQIVALDNSLWIGIAAWIFSVKMTYRLVFDLLYFLAQGK
jgi:hypothetical protein